MFKFLPRKLKAFSLIEILLSISILFLLATILIGALIYSRESAALAGARGRAVLIAEEGLEAVRNIKDENFVNLVDGTYGLVIAGGEWTLGAAPDTTDVFAREVIITTISPTIKEITVNVTWKQTEQRQGNISLMTQLSAWQ